MEDVDKYLVGLVDEVRKYDFKCKYPQNRAKILEDNMETIRQVIKKLEKNKNNKFTKWRNIYDYRIQGQINE